MRQVLLVLSFIVVFSACEKNHTNNDDGPSLYGRYVGTFHRTGMDTAQVQLAFLGDNKFEGTSDRPLYPAVCEGSFTFDKASKVLSVSNTCVWTADFDWTLIFDGDYDIDFKSENSVRILRTNGAITDEYNLNRMVR